MAPSLGEEGGMFTVGSVGPVQWLDVNMTNRKGVDGQYERLYVRSGLQLAARGS
jgi:hypothetical protein